MKKVIIFSFWIFTIFACTKEEFVSQKERNAESKNLNDDSAGVFVPGVSVVKFTEDMIDLIEGDLSRGKVVTKSMTLNQALDELGIVSIKRVFEYAGEFEPRTRAAGLHRWYAVEYAKDVPAAKAVNEFRSMPGVEYVERRHRIAINDFDDPGYSMQWHYFNDGNKGKKGADINVRRVWKDYTTGDSRVIVSVVDGGIDPDHKDLKDNFIPGGSGGSRNFVDGNFVITAHRHGTHVGGIIAAVNNNGKGICGIAGGDKANNKSGVKLLNSQIFATKNGKEVGGLSGAQGIKYGADHGAVISQNSWGYLIDTDGDGRISEKEKATALAMRIDHVDKDAVDYFIKHAGCAADGTQKPNSMMKGGVVIFAAGNDAFENGAPANYDPIIAVGAIDKNGNRSYFSNFGDWVDIAAPGTSIYSTYPNNSYGLMSGTSMACPHVSGVAALVVSHCGGQGFTNKMLEERLIKGAKTGFLPAKANIGPLVDALGSITYGNTDVPSKVDSYTATPVSNSVDMSWNVTSDSKNRPAYGYMLLASKDKNVFKNIKLNEPGENIKVSRIETPEGAKTGDAIKGSLKDLDFDSDYFVAIAGYDYRHNFSELSEVKHVRTLRNNPPVITLGQKLFIIKAFQTVYCPIGISDPDGHDVTVQFDPGSNAAELVRNPIDQSYLIKFVGFSAPAKVYQAKISVKDKYGLSAERTFNYEILENQVPVKKKDFENILVYGDIGKKFIFKCDDYFSDPDGEELRYEIMNSNNNIIYVNNSKTAFFATILDFGLSTITITAIDAFGKRVSGTFKVVVRKQGNNVEAYPNPVKDRLYLCTGKDEVETYVKIVSLAGAVVYERRSVFSAFRPLEIDFSNMAPGRYSVFVSYGGKASTNTVVKY